MGGSITLPLEVLQKYGTEYFVETGSFTGGAIEEAINASFSDIRSVEIDPGMYATCVDRFANDTRVTLYFGDSLDLLPEMIDDIDEKITFWLDAHAGNSPTAGRLAAPLLEELDIIAKHKRRDHVLLIDDVRLFGKRGWDFVTKYEVLERILAINSKYAIVYENSKGFERDILVAYIPEDEGDEGD